MMPRHPHPLIIALAVVGLTFFLVPLAGLVGEVPWSDLPGLLTSDVALDALRLSLLASLSASLISVVLGVPLAYFLARTEFRGRGVVRGLVLLPLVLPPVVGGAALLFALGRRGLFGEPLYEATGLVLPFSMTGVILATTFVSMPFLVITVEGAIRAMDPRFEDAALTLGAHRWTVLRRVTLPMVGPSLLSGVVLTWARAFGEFGATVTFAGSLQGETQTLPLAVFIGLESQRDLAIAMSLLMVLVAFAVLVALRDRWWRAL